MSSTPLDKIWHEKALGAVLSHWNAERSFAWRTSSERADHYKNFSDSTYHPSVTFHAVIAFSEGGLFAPELKASDGTIDTAWLSVPYYDISIEKKSLNPYEILRRIIYKDGSSVKSNNWIEHILVQSSHSQKDAPGGEKRKAILLGLLFSALQTLVPHLNDAGKDEDINTLLSTVIDGLPEAYAELVSVVRKDTDKHKSLVDELELCSSREFSPHLLHSVVQGLQALNNLQDYISNKTKARKPEPIWSELNQKLNEQGVFIRKDGANLVKLLRGYFKRQVDRIMAHRGVSSDPEYDVTSLAFALRGLYRLDPDIKGSPYYLACVKTIVEGQGEDGCWPEGVSIANPASGDIIQQPSVQTALLLARSVVRRRSLIQYDTADIELLRTASPALQRFAQYLYSSFNSKCSDSIPPDSDSKIYDRRATGWSSDRVRWAGHAETWISALAARLFNYIRLSRIILERAEVLEKYPVQWPRAVVSSEWEENRERRTKVWRELVRLDPDSVAKPLETVDHMIFNPIDTKYAEGKNGPLFKRPDRDGVGFIVFGPPGSGKTTVLKEIACAIGWPLLSLNPGHFIKNGLEQIEATSAEVFKDLMSLDHVVIFFDECDELFRQRQSGNNNSDTRGILNFATACMLPKLQDLHDQRRAVFFLGTNYLANVDTAIRRPGRFDKAILIDRPDEKARRNIIEKELGKSLKRPVGTANDLTKEAIDALVVHTNGYMVKQIKGAVAKCVKDGGLNLLTDNKLDRALLPKQANISDYIKWCCEDSHKEINACESLDESEKKKILQRWWDDIVRPYLVNEPARKDFERAWRNIDQSYVVKR